AAMQFLFGPLMGNLSDQVGRRPVLMLSLAALGIDYLLMAIAPTMFLLLVARIVSGVAGASYATASAYLADISPPEKRAANFGLIGASFGIGFVIGPLIGGLLGELGPRAPFVAAGVLALANAVLAFFLLPESLKPENRRPFSWAKANPFRALADIGKLPEVGGLMLVNFLIGVASWVYPAIWSYYTIYVFGFSSAMVGASLTVYGVALAVVQGGLIRPVLRRFGEVNTVWLGLGLTIAGFLLLVMVRETWVLFLLIPFLATGDLVDPALQGLMSNRMGDDEQGALQGVVAAVNGIATMIAPLFFTGIFWMFTYEGSLLILPGAPFLVAAVLTVLAFWPLRRVVRMAR
ncbi:MAG: MFS transporter, partial [Pseudomonadota bacterium]